MNQIKIIEQLQKILKNAHCPYSGIQVAAAVEYEIEGETHVAYGVNVENVSYGLTICAERSAISNAVVNGMKYIKSLYVMSNQSEAISPCGACRQVVCEFMDDPSNSVVCINQTLDKKWISTMGELLPNRFDL